MECATEEFASALPTWYKRFTCNNYYKGWGELLHRPNVAFTPKLKTSLQLGPWVGLYMTRIQLLLGGT